MIGICFAKKSVKNQYKIKQESKTMIARIEIRFLNDFENRFLNDFYTKCIPQ